MPVKSPCISWDGAGTGSSAASRALSELLRVLQGGGRPTTFGRAVAELGRITMTLYLLAYLDDETYRPRILTQLNRTESRHALARAVFHGQRRSTAPALRRRPGRPTRRPSLSAWSSTPSCCGTPATRTPPWTSCAATVTTSGTTTYDGCHRSPRTTRTSSAATSSVPPTSPTGNSDGHLTSPLDNLGIESNPRLRPISDVTGCHSLAKRLEGSSTHRAKLEGTCNSSGQVALVLLDVLLLLRYLGNT